MLEKEVHPLWYNVNAKIYIFSSQNFHFYKKTYQKESLKFGRFSSPHFMILIFRAFILSTLSGTFSVNLRGTKDWALFVKEKEVLLRWISWCSRTKESTHSLERWTEELFITFIYVHFHPRICSRQWFTHLILYWNFLPGSQKFVAWFHLYQWFILCASQREKQSVT